MRVGSTLNIENNEWKYTINAYERYTSLNINWNFANANFASVPPIAGDWAICSAYPIVFPPTAHLWLCWCDAATRQCVLHRYPHLAFDWDHVEWPEFAVIRCHCWRPGWIVPSIRIQMASNWPLACDNDELNVSAATRSPHEHEQYQRWPLWCIVWLLFGRQPRWPHSFWPAASVYSFATEPRARHLSSLYSLSEGIFTVPQYWSMHEICGFLFLILKKDTLDRCCPFEEW